MSKLSKVNCSRGAPMGRGDTVRIRPDHGSQKGDFKVRVTMMRLTEGYDEGGAYWGDRCRGESLYRVYTSDGQLELFFDGTCVQDVKNKVLAKYPKVIFHKCCF